jgi:hypothetical protein
MERTALDWLQSKLEEQVEEHFPDGGVQRVALLQYGDDPQIEPGDLWVRVFFKVAGVPRTAKDRRRGCCSSLPGRPPARRC